MSKVMHRMGTASRGGSVAAPISDTSRTANQSTGAETPTPDVKAAEKPALATRPSSRELEGDARSRTRGSVKGRTEAELAKTPENAPPMPRASDEVAVSPECPASIIYYTDRFGKSHPLNNAQTPAGVSLDEVGMAGSSNSSREVVASVVPEPSTTSSEIPPFDSTICVMYLLRQCYGQRCRRTHPSEEEIAYLLSQESLRPKQTAEVCRAFLKGRCHWGVFCHRVHSTENKVLPLKDAPTPLPPLVRSFAPVPRITHLTTNVIQAVADENANIAPLSNIDGQITHAEDAIIIANAKRPPVPSAKTPSLPPLPKPVVSSEHTSTVISAKLPPAQSSDPVAGHISRVTSGPTLPARPREICKKFMDNRCKGDQCSRFHPPKESAPAAPSQEPIASPAAPSKPYMETLVPLEKPVATKPALVAPPNKVTVVPPAKKSKPRKDPVVMEECRDFMKGKCSNGPSCPRIHPAAEIKEVSIASAVPSKAQCASVPSKKTPKTPDVLITPNAASPAGAKAADVASATVPEVPQSAQICKKYQKRQCRRGKSCSYLHQMQDKQEQAPVQPENQTPVKDEIGSGSAKESAPSSIKSPNTLDTPGAEAAPNTQGLPRTNRGQKKKAPPEASKAPIQEPQAATPPPHPVRELGLLEQQAALAVVNLPRPSRSLSITTQVDEALPGGHSTESSFSADSQASENSAVTLSNFSVGESSQSSVSQTETTSGPQYPPHICRDWQRGRCQWGTRCKYTHTVPVVMAEGCSKPPPSELSSLTMRIPGCSQASQEPSLRKATAPLKSTPPLTQRNLPPPPGLPSIIPTRSVAPPSSSQLAESHKSAVKAPPPQPLTPQPPPPRVAVTVLEHTKVSLGPGFEVQGITTGFESRWLILGNVAQNVTEKTILRALKPFGEVEEVRIQANPNNSPVTAVRALFATPAEAMQAAGALNGAYMWQHKLTARLPINNTAAGNGTLKDSSVWLEWDVPGRLGFAGYASQAEAEAVVQAANGSIIRDSCIAAAIHEGLPTLGAANVRFFGLPPVVDKTDLEQFGQAEEVMLERPNYTSLAHATKCIQGLLDEFGEVVGFEIYPAPYRDGRVKAWAHFPSPNIAQTVSQHLNGRRPFFLGKGMLSARHVQAITYSLPLPAYEKMASDIAWLRQSFWMRNAGAALSVLDHRTKRLHGAINIPVHVKLAAEDVRELGRLKSEFEHLLHGEKLMQNGKVVWDGFFGRPEGVSYIQDLERRNPGVQIQQAVGRRTITLFGPLWKRRNVHRALLDRIARFRAQRIRSIPLPARTIGLFMSTDFMDLARKMGHDNVTLDLGRLTLSVRGDDAAFDTAQRAVRDALKKYPGERDSHGADMCPVCFSDVVSPIRLLCGHSWCKSCFANYLLASIDNKAFPLKCLGAEAKCSQTISVTAARDVLSANDFDAVADAAFHSYVYARPDEFHYCPTTNCPQIYRTAPPGTILQCPSCLARICPSCHTLAHDGISCTDRDTDGDKLFKEWMDNHDVKACPGCKASIERIAGCNHMTCIRCQTHICWECSQTFPKGEGIYQHMRAEHGGIGLL